MESSRVFQKKPLKSSSSGARFARRKLPSEATLREEVMDRQLKVIYQDRNGRKRDLTRLDRSRRFPWFKALGIVMLLAILGVGGWKAYQLLNIGSTRFGDEQVELSMDAPKSIAVGQRTSIKVTAVNRSPLKLNNLDLLLQYPKEWEYISSSVPPEGTEQRRWKLGSLEAGASATLQVDGRFWGTSPGSADIHASLVFTPETLRASFRSSASATVGLDPSIVTATVKSPDRLNLGQKEEWGIDVASKAPEPVSNLAVEILLPNQFLLDATTPTADTSAGLVWKGLTVSSDKPTTLKFSGTFVDTSSASTGGDGQPATKQFTVRLLHGDQLPQLISEANATAVVIQSTFSVRLAANGSLTRSDILPATSIPVKIEVVNHGADPVSDVQASLTFQSAAQLVDMINFDALDTKNAPTVNGTTLTWDKKSVDVLSFIRGGDTAVITVNLPIRSQALGSMDLTAHAQYANAGSTVSVDSNSVTLAIASPLSLAAGGRYYSDDNLALGTGPLPPQVGQTTTLALILSINKKVGAYKSIDATFTVPTGVTIVRVQAPVGTITSDRTSNTIRWKVESMPANVTSLSADARVAITPNVNQIGTVLPLLTGGSLKAQDAQTSTAITQTTSLPVTTNIDGDPQVAGRGTVVAQ